jgi:hypothetical protein
MDAKSPTILQDDDGDGFVELAEGEETYGPIQLNLTLNPEDSAHDHGTEGHDHTGEAMFPTPTRTASCATPRPSASTATTRTPRPSSTASPRSRPRRSCCTG